MLYIDSKKVDMLMENHKAYLEKILQKRCKDEINEISHFESFFIEYCGYRDNDIVSISDKLIEVCLSSNLESVINEFNMAFFNTYKKNLLYELKKSKEMQFIEATAMTELLNDLLNYSGFSKRTKGWNRHIYVSKLGVRSCPYCNRNYITSYEHDDYLHTTADVDHYYPKSLYPILQMNLYNMIPCCCVCNSRMKLDNDERHLYPFQDREQSLLFRTEDKTIEQLYNYSADDITIDILPHIDQDGRSQGSIDVFNLKQVYSSHKNIAHELIERIYNYQEMKEDYYAHMLGKDLYGKIWDEQNFRSIWFDFLYKEALDEPLVKMKQDIYRQLCSEETEKV